MPAHEPLTAERLRELLHYEPETGIFTWKIAPPRKPWLVGRVAGTPHGEGYLVLKIAQRMYLAHRLAWLYVHGTWPAAGLDHRNGTRSDNRIDNLRPASQSVNLQNQRKAKSNSKTGVLGVRPYQHGRFSAQIVLGGKPVWLGHFATTEEAHAAYLAAKRQHHQGCTI